MCGLPPGHHVWSRRSMVDGGAARDCRQSSQHVSASWQQLGQSVVRRLCAHCMHKYQCCQARRCNGTNTLQSSASTQQIRSSCYARHLMREQPQRNSCRGGWSPLTTRAAALAETNATLQAFISSRPDLRAFADAHTLIPCSFPGC